MIGSCAVIALARTRIPGRGLLLAVAVGPLVVPRVVMIGARRDLQRSWSRWGRAAFILAHAVLATPCS